MLYMLIKFSYPYIFGILVRCSGKSALGSMDVCVSRIESIKCLFGKDVGAGDSWRSPLRNSWWKAYLHPPSEDNAASAARPPPLSKPFLESGWWRRDWQDRLI